MSDETTPIEEVDVMDDVDLMPLEADASPATADSDARLERLRDVPVELTVEIGRTHMTIGETLELGPGSVVTVDRLAGEPVDLLVNGRPIARGEVVVIEEEFGIRITEVVAHGMSAALALPDAPA